MIEITIKEAIEQGYTCALSEEGDYFTYLAGLDKDDFDNGVDLFLGSKETFKFKISESAVKDLIEQHLENQDEVNDESEQLYDQMKNIDFAAIANLINPHFTTNYHSVTDIKLKP